MFLYQIKQMHQLHRMRLADGMQLILNNLLMSNSNLLVLACSKLLVGKLKTLAIIPSILINHIL